MGTAKSVIRLGKFELGITVMTVGVKESIPNEEIQIALSRHQIGDWGDSSEPELNEEGLKDGDSLMSVYKSKKDIIFWIITEGDRSCTTVLLPTEY